QHQTTSSKPIVGITFPPPGTDPAAGIRAAIGMIAFCFIELKVFFYCDTGLQFEVQPLPPGPLVKVVVKTSGALVTVGRIPKARPPALNLLPPGRADVSAPPPMPVVAAVSFWLPATTLSKAAIAMMFLDSTTIS